MCRRIGSPEGTDRSNPDVPKEGTYRGPKSRRDGPMEAQGQAMRAQRAWPQGTMIKEFGSHNVAALNEIGIGGTHGIRAVPLGLRERVGQVTPGLLQRSLRSP